MSKIISLSEIKKILDTCSDSSLIQLIENGFVSYSNGEVLVAPVGHLPFTNPPGDLHIKYGYVKGKEYFVVKMASGFYENPSLGLSASNGLMLVFSQKTGELLSILLDEGHLTDIRTALAGAVVAKHLSPKNVTRIGIVGTGIQARLQLRYLKSVLDCRNVIVWGRSQEKMEAYASDSILTDFNIATTRHIDELTATCNLIVTTTPSKNPLLLSTQIMEGTHITAVGADTPGKVEVDPALFERADIVVADSISQCIDHGDCASAIAAGTLDAKNIIELGTFITSGKKRSDDSAITIADLTGVAVQDINIAELVYGRAAGLP